MFTYHAYLSWLPDRARGYVARGRGVLPPDRDQADAYRRRAKEPAAEFDERIQELIIEEALVAAGHQALTVMAVSTDSTHAHVIVEWSKPVGWQTVQAGVRQSLTRRLNRDVSRRTWFSEDASRKRVRDADHLSYLRGDYLPKHSGWKWDCDRGFYR